MNLDMSQLDNYERDIAVCRQAIDDAKSKLDFLRLQAKQTRESAVRAKRDPLIKAFIKAMPKDFVEVMPSPGCVYVSVRFGSVLQASLYAEVPEKLGLVLSCREKQSDTLHAPTVSLYRVPGVAFYITSPAR